MTYIKDKGYEDIFGKLIADTTTNESNLASHYPYSPERWRLFLGSNASGNRLFPEYGAVSQYNHAGPVHELKPAAGETVILESAEQFRYVVSYQIQATFSMAINQSLSGDDYIRCGFYDGTDGWFLEHNSTHASNECDLVELEAGTETYRETNTVDKSFQEFRRFSIDTAWYRTTGQHWGESYPDTSNGEQVNSKIGSAASALGNGPEVGNLNLRYEVNADAATTGLILQAGSCSVVTQGSGEDNTRSKSSYFTDTVGATDVWSPVRAFREVPDRTVINNQILDLNIIRYSVDTPVQVSILCFDETNVTFAGTDSWDTPANWNNKNNSIETRVDVDQIADSTGALATDPADPGGFQSGFAVLAPTTGNQFQKGASDANLGVKRNLPNGDIAVVVVNVGSTGDIGYNVTFEQDW